MVIARDVGLFFGPAPLSWSDCLLLWFGSDVYYLSLQNLSVLVFFLLRFGDLRLSLLDSYLLIMDCNGLIGRSVPLVFIWIKRNVELVEILLQVDQISLVLSQDILLQQILAL